MAWISQMDAVGRPSVRPDWQIQAFVLGVIALLGTLPFWLTDLDIQVASHFYHPETDDPWLEGQRPLWSFLYAASPLLTGLVMLAGLLALVAGGLWTRLRTLRLYAVLVLATVLVGPGLLVNIIFKDHLGRPRPHQVEALGGTQAYLPPLLPGEAGQGKSFPCGHSSVGYMLGVFFLIWRRRRPWLAWAVLVAALAMGTLLGLGRMAAGDHFLSDVIWSGIIAYGVALTLYVGVLRIPKREAAQAAQPPAPPGPPRQPHLVILGYGVLALVMLSGVLLATPVSDNARELVRRGEFHPDPRVLRIEADHVNLILYRMEGPDLGLIRLRARGFGLPTAQVNQDLEARDGVLTFRLTHRGVFTERATQLVVGVAASQWERIEARVGVGDILVHPLGSEVPELDLESASGSLVLE
jgi:membrane-associated PAP2 superfamily phosphatase